MSPDTNEYYVPGLYETVAAAIVAVADSRLSSLLAYALREAGIAVRETNSYADITTQTDACRLYVIDADSEAGDAITLLRVLRGQDVTTSSAMMLLTGHDNEIEAYDAGVDMVLSKPLSVPLFMARVRSVLRRYNVIL